MFEGIRRNYGTQKRGGKYLAEADDFGQNRDEIRRVSEGMLSRFSEVIGLS